MSIEPILGKCDYCGSLIVAKKDRSKQGRYRRFCGQTCKNKQNKIGSALNLMREKEQSQKGEYKSDRCVDCGSADVIVKVGNKGFCAGCVNK